MALTKRMPKIRRIPLEPEPPNPEATQAYLDKVRTYLDHLERTLEHTTPDPHLDAPDALPVQLTRPDIERIKRIHQRVQATPRPDRTHIEKALLTLLAHTLDPSLVPFWSTLIAAPDTDHNDPFAPQRRSLAFMALGLFLGLGLELDGAHQALIAILHASRDARPHTRAQAARLLGLWPDDLPTEALDRLLDITRADPACLPRFDARRALEAMDLPAPPDIPRGVYAFAAHLAPYRFVLEMRAKATIDDLHRALSTEMGWDPKRPFAFHLSGDPQDTAYELPINDRKALVLALLSQLAGQDLSEEEEPLRLCDLGLVPGHSFLYEHEAAAHHHVRVDVLRADERTARGAKYPRVIERTGKRPTKPS